MSKAQPKLWTRLTRSGNSVLVHPLFHPSSPQKEIPMAIGVSVAHIQPVVALLAGILILIVPRLLNFIVAAYLIVIGLIGLGIFH